MMHKTDTAIARAREILYAIDDAVGFGLSSSEENRVVRLLANELERWENEHKEDRVEVRKNRIVDRILQPTRDDVDWYKD